MNLLRRIAFLLPAFALSVSFSRAETITVFAAASLADALVEASKPFEKDSGHTVRFSFGSSGMLARQISEGAPADVFVSADETRIETLARNDLIDRATLRTLVSNTLVVVVPAGSEPTAITLAHLKLPRFKRLALGEPATVPAGTYAQECLQRAGLWTELRSKCLPLENVRAVLAAVEAGNVDAGFVYSTDALSSTRVHVAFHVPATEAPPIRYPAAVLKASRHASAARALLEHLGGAEAQAVFRRRGFGAAEQPKATP